MATAGSVWNKSSDYKKFDAGSRKTLVRYYVVMRQHETRLYTMSAQPLQPSQCAIHLSASLDIISQPASVKHIKTNLFLDERGFQEDPVLEEIISIREITQGYA